MSGALVRIRWWGFMKMREFTVPKRSEIHVRVFSAEESEMKYCQRKMQVIERINTKRAS